MVMQASQENAPSAEKATSVLPIILLGSIATTRTEERFMKLAFLADEEIFKDKKMYSDWIGQYYGPHSDNLLKDLEYYSRVGDIKIKRKENSIGNYAKFYSLTDAGHEKFDSMFVEFYDYIAEIRKSLCHYQHHDINAYLMQDVYNKYPQYAKNDWLKKKLGRN